jgi:predicted glycosyltransferase
MLWVDIENPPQVQYLMPLVEAWRRRGEPAIVTARDYGATFELLESRHEAFHAVGSSYGASKAGKVRGLLGRARALVSELKGGGVPDRLVCASRAGVLAARRLGVPSYVISDYEYANLTVFRWARSVVLFPDVISAGVYMRAGFPAERVLPFRGIKEDLTFSGVDLDSIERAALEGGENGSLSRVLVRPPAEESHYYTSRSRELYLAALGLLAENKAAQVVLSPRYAHQVDDLGRFSFANGPIVLDRPFPFVALLKAVDLVLCSGGTMLREAAYLGIPSYSIFQSRVGEVDRYLERIGRATLLSSADDLDRITMEKTPALSPLASNPRLVEELTAIIAGNRSR